MNQAIVKTKQGQGEALNILGMELRFLCTGDQTGRAWSMLETVLPQHTGAPPHEHPWGEAYYLLAGQVRFTVGGEEHLMEPGDFLYAPGGTVHSFRCESAEPARILIVDAPAHSQAFFRELDREVKGPDDMPKIHGIGARNGITFRFGETAGASSAAPQAADAAEP
ncbi:MAG: cupin domain-containing protein [Burkholderiaceae bacterium]